jgi:hypothetical protein
MSRSRSILAVVALLAVTAGCATLSGGPPAMTVDSQDDTRYRLHVFAVADADGRTDVAFRATTDDGARRYVGVADLQSGAHYANVTLAEEAVHRRQFTVAPAGNVTATVEDWEQGTVWGYVLETPANETLVGADAVDCERGGQTYHLTVADGTRERWSSTCG